MELDGAAAASSSAESDEQVRAHVSLAPLEQLHLTPRLLAAVGCAGGLEGRRGRGARRAGAVQGRGMRLAKRMFVIVADPVKP